MDGAHSDLSRPHIPGWCKKRSFAGAGNTPITQHSLVTRPAFNRQIRGSIPLLGSNFSRVSVMGGTPNVCQ